MLFFIYYNYLIFVVIFIDDWVIFSATRVNFFFKYCIVIETTPAKFQGNWIVGSG